MSILTSLPDAILSTVLSDWLTAAHIARLDSACCHKDTRSAFVHTAYGPTTLFRNPFPAGDMSPKNTALDGMVMWLLKRGAAMAELYVTDTVAKNEKLVEEYLAVRGTAVQNVILLTRYPSDRIIDMIIMHCTNLVAFHSEVTLSASVLSRIVGGFPKLTDIALLGLCIDETLDAIIQACPRLEKVKVIRHRAVTEDALTGFVTKCPRLKYLHVGLAGEDRSARIIEETFFVHLAASCPQLTELHITDAYVTEVGIKALAEGCHKLHTLSLSAARMRFTTTTAPAVLPSLREFRLEMKLEMMLVKKFLDALLRCFPAVRKLSLSGLHGVTSEELVAATAHLPHLQSIHLGGCEFLTDQLVQGIAHSCPDLQSVSLRCCSNGQQYQQRALVRGPALPPVTGPDNATREQQLATAQEVLSGCCETRLRWQRTKNEWHKLSSEGIVTLFEGHPSLMRVETLNCRDSASKERTYELVVH